jgi:hypothetical protein
MTIDLTAGIVRILNSEGLTSGTGFVVSDEGLIATCSHVVQSEDSQQRGDPRPDHVDVIFHATGDCRRAIVEPGWWRAHDVEDVAILRLEGILPEDATPLPLGSSQHSKGHPFSSRGYRLAEYFPEGLEAEGKIQGYTSYRDQPVLQLLTNQIDQGMSGAPIWDVKSRRVVGISSGRQCVTSTRGWPLPLLPRHCARSAPTCVYQTYAPIAGWLPSPRQTPSSSSGVRPWWLT